MSDPLRNMARRIQNAVRAVRSTVVPNDMGSVQTVQLRHSSAQTVDQTKTLYHYGYSASPPVGCDFVVVHVAGDTSNGIAIASGHQASRPKGLTPGQVLIYDSSGSRVLLDPAHGKIVLTPSGGTVEIDGQAIITGDAVIGGKSFLQHVHGGVQGGSSDTGAPI